MRWLRKLVDVAQAVVAAAGLFERLAALWASLRWSLAIA